MYKIQNNVNFYLFDYKQQSFIHMFSSEDELIQFLVNTTRYEWLDGKIHNSYFEYLNMNGNDIHNFFGLFENAIQLRPYIFIDSNDRIIDIRKYKEIVFDEFKQKAKNVSFRRDTEKVFKYGDILYACGDIPYRYRIDPVPCIHKRFRYYGIRHMKTTQELRQISDIEYGKYIRSKRKQIPTCYDDIPRKSQKSWKEQSKKRKQWM